MVVLILISITVSNQHVGLIKLTQWYVTIISQKSWNSIWLYSIKIFTLFCLISLPPWKKKFLWEKKRHFSLRFYSHYEVHNLTSKGTFFRYEKNFVFINSYQKIWLPSSNLYCRSYIFKANQIYDGFFPAYLQKWQAS